MRPLGSGAHTGCLRQALLPAEAEELRLSCGGARLWAQQELVGPGLLRVEARLPLRGGKGGEAGVWEWSLTWT